jgi:hypothetical protein
VLHSRTYKAIYIPVFDCAPFIPVVSLRLLLI